MPNETNSARPGDDTGAALPLALMLVCALVIGAVMLAGGSALSNTKTRADASRVAARSLAEAAVADATAAFNTGPVDVRHPDPAGVPTRVRGFVPTGRPGATGGGAEAGWWAWWSETGDNPGRRIVHATGWAERGPNGGSTVGLDAVVDSIQVTGMSEGKYTLASGQVTSAAVTVFDEIVLNNMRSSVFTYDSTNPSANVTGGAPLASAGSIQTAGLYTSWNGTGAPGSVTWRLFDWAANPVPDRCRVATGDGRCWRVETFAESVTGLDTGSILDRVNHCRVRTPDRPTWTASVDAVHHPLAPGDNCYTQVVFDRDVNVQGNPLNPTVLWVSGPVTVMPGVKVNWSGPGPGSTAGNLWVFTAGEDVTLNADEPGRTETSVAWTLWAPRATCAASGTGPTNWFGSHLCNRFTDAGPVRLGWDAPRGASDTVPGLPGAHGTPVWSTVRVADRVR